MTLLYPRLRSDVYYAEEDQQPIVAVDGKRYVLPSKGMLTLLERLSPHLNGRTSLEQITRPLPEAQQRAVRSLVGKLHEVGAVREHQDARTVQLPAWLEGLYQATLDYLDALGPLAHRTFVALRERHVTVVGGGSALRVLAPALWNAGIARGTVHASPQDPFLELLHSDLQVRRALDPHMQWSVQTLDRPDLPFTDLLVVVGSLDFVENTLQDVQSSTRVLPVVLSDSFSTIGPVVQGGDLQCLKTRIQGFTAPSDSYSAYSVTGARAALEVFKLLAGHDTPARDALVRIDQQQLTDTVHPLLPLQGPVQAPPFQVEHLEKSLAGSMLFNRFSGLMHQLDPEDLPQLPVPTWAARLRETPEERLAFAGSTLLQAKTQALLGALMQRFPGHTAGLTESQWKGLGVLQLARQEVLDRVLPWDFSSDLDPDARFWFRTLAVRYQLPPTLTLHPSALAEIPVARLETARFTLHAAGRTPPEALKTVLLLGVAHLQLEQEARGAASHGVQLPAEPHGQALDWERWLASLPLQVNGTPDPTLQSLGVWVGPVEVQP